MTESTALAIQTVSNLVLDQIRTDPKAVLGLATGKTMEPVYEEWVKNAKALSLDHSQCYFFMLDEYLGLPEDHPASFTSYIKERLLLPLNLKLDQISFPPVHSASLETSARTYEEKIREKKGIDLQLLGIGQNGHIGFNEPGSMGDSRTRVVNLSSKTIEANRSQFENGIMPDKALSMGIATILESKRLILLATGSSKAEAIRYLIDHQDDSYCPATFLKSHPHFTLVLDPAAASKID